MSENQKKEEISNLVEVSLSFSGLLLFPGLIGSILVGERILAIYGDEFTKGSEVLTILIFAHLVYTFQQQFTNTLNALDRPNLTFYINGLFVLMNVVLNIFLIYHFGWIGAAIASAGSAGVCLLLGYAILTKIVKINIIRCIRNVSYQLLSAVIMGASIHMLQMHLDTSIFSISILISCGGVIYFSTLFVISAEFRRTILKIYKNKQI
jgi:O-antigen/teichoic acid export membrane protein